MAEKELSPKELLKLKESDEGYVAAQKDTVSFLNSKRQGVFRIARMYHLDGEELLQEGYEILLTCLRDFTPVYTKTTGESVHVKFVTFFNNRMESQAMEMRNKNPEYLARKAFSDGLSSEERERFKKDPPLLVQHMDQENALQEALSNEVSKAKGEENPSLSLKIVRDSFFDKVISGLISKEKDEKKKAALLHIKVGGVYNFQEIAYHFGVTDSRASQVLNALMDAFYVQRMISGDLKSVLRDAEMMKFKEKRVERMVKEALTHVKKERKKEIIEILSPPYPALKELSLEGSGKRSENKEDIEELSEERKILAPAYEDVFTEEENVQYPLQMVELRKIKSLVFTDHVKFRSEQSEQDFLNYIRQHKFDDGRNPVIISQQGIVIDGNRRLRIALKEGRSDYMCIVREVKDEVVCKILRISLNLRRERPSKPDLYHAISALSDLGLSQQKIASYVGTSRTNIVVYLKLKEKASTHMHALFEDSLIQITNAVSCLEFTDNVQDKLAIFIRKYGKKWSKGSHFNELYTAAAKGTIDSFIAEVSGEIISVQDKSSKKASKKIPNVEEARVDAHIVTALHKRIEGLESQLQDVDVWNARREKVLAQQAQEMRTLQEESELLKKELEAAELKKFANPEQLENEIKGLKTFYGICERMAGANYAFDKLSKEIARLTFSRKQKIELQHLFEDVEKKVNKLRIAIINNTVK